MAKPRFDLSEPPGGSSGVEDLVELMRLCPTCDGAAQFKTIDAEQNVTVVTCRTCNGERVIPVEQLYVN